MRLADEDRGLVEPAREADGGPASSGRDGRPVLDRVREEALEPGPLHLADERPELDVGVRPVPDAEARGLRP